MASPSPPYVVEDMPPFLQLLSDGTVIRFPDYNNLPPPPAPPAKPDVQWKDVVYDPEHGLKLRLYKPPAAASSSGKLPVLAYFHGGGFIIGSFDMPNFHAFCLRLAGELPAAVLAADYRLAPEHRLPAALDDAATFLSWVRGQADQSAADPWLAESADFGRLFVSGDSAGGNIAHNVAVRLGSGGPDEVAGVVGYALLCPMFGGERRTASEAELPPTPALSLPKYDQTWRLVLPPGATRDHRWANPFGPGSPPLDAVALPPTLVVVAGQDLLRDRGADYAARLMAMGKPVELVEFDGEQHDFFIAEPFADAGSEVVRTVKRFVYGNGGDTDVSS